MNMDEDMLMSEYGFNEELLRTLSYLREEWYGYQFGVGTIEVLIDNEWHIFKKYKNDEWNE